MELQSIKIRNAAGLYSTGGTSPSFKKRGKTWSMLGHVSSHLGHLRDVPDDWQIIVAKISDDGFTPSSITVINAREHWKSVMERREDARQKYLLSCQQARVDREQQEFERLNKIYGNKT